MDHLAELNAKQQEKRERREKKKVRFAGDIAEIDDDDDKPRKPLFPKGKKKDEEDDLAMDATNGGVLPSDPRVAALARLKKRDKEKEIDEVELLDDIEGAEEEFGGKDEDEENDIEPFNLKKEREEGYFDADGNYVEYRAEKPVTDAWLDNAEVDERFAEEAAAKAAVLEDPPEDLSAEEIGSIKRRIADALLPGENVLGALKRLGGERQRVQGTKKGVGSKMDPEQKQRFDKLTEDAMKLMDNGEYGVYNEKKETFQREAEGYEALARARSGPSKRGSDMFGDSDEDEEQPAQPPAKRRLLVADEEEDRVGSAEANGSAPPGSSTGQEMEAEALPELIPGEETGYVLDPHSGYYYNSQVGYYYDSKSGFYCNAATGLWYRYIQATNSYVEVRGDSEA